MAAIFDLHHRVVDSKTSGKKIHQQKNKTNVRTIKKHLAITHCLK